MENIQIGGGGGGGRRNILDIMTTVQLVASKRILICATNKVDADKTITRLKELLEGKTIIEEPYYNNSQSQMFINELSELPEFSVCSSRKYAGTLIYLEK